MNNMLRLRRKQQKATARLSNFINKQTREDSRATSARDENRQLPFTLVTGVYNSEGEGISYESSEERTTECGERNKQRRKHTTKYKRKTTKGHLS